MHLYGTNYGSPRKGNADNSIVMKVLPNNTFTLTALVARVSMTSFPTFQTNELHTLKETVTFHIDAGKIPADICCSCLHGGRFCLIASHWLLEYDPSSEFWLGEDGEPRTGSLIRYTGQKKGNRSVVTGDNGERVCCIEGLMKPVPEQNVSPTASLFTA